MVRAQTIAAAEGQPARPGPDDGALRVMPWYGAYRRTVWRVTPPRRLRSSGLFPTDGPVAPDRLIGREDEVDELANALDNGINRILIGPRRTGKTSVALAALEEVRERGSYTVSVDLFRVGSRAELAETLVRALVANRSAPRRAGAAARRTGRHLAEAATLALSTRLKTDLGEEVEIVFTPGLAARDPDRYLDYAFSLPQRVAELDDTHVVLFLDEFQEVASARSPYGDADALTKRLRAVLQRSDRVATLFAGSIEHLMRDLFVPEKRAFYRFGGVSPLGPVAEQAWADGIRERLAQDRTTIEPLALADLLRRSEGHPRVTMLLAQQAHSLAVLLGRRRIDGELVDEAHVEALAADWVSHQTEVERIRELGKHTFDVARRLARGTPPYAGTEAKAVQRALDALVTAGLVERANGPGGRPGWRVIDPLLREFLASR
jgi:uncharacterized protein